MKEAILLLLKASNLLDEAESKLHAELQEEQDAYSMVGKLHKLNHELIEFGSKLLDDLLDEDRE